VIDGRWVRVDSGIGQYIYWLVRHLPEVAPDLEFSILLSPSRDPLVGELAVQPGVEPIFLSGSPRRPKAWKQVISHLWTRRPVLYHGPNWIGVPALPGAWRTVVTVHDLIPLVAPEWVPASLLARHPHLYRAALSTIVRSASVVLTDSRVWASELVSRLRVPEDRIRVIPLGVAPSLPMSTQRIREVREKFGIANAPYVLAVGRPERYKGLVPLIHCFASTRREENLVVAGPLDVRYTQAADAATRAGVDDHVIFTGSVDPETLECLYRGATVFAMLSRLEGFGLPPLEAMARGVPVLATRIPVFRETLGEAALLVDPDDLAQAGTSLRQLLRDDELRRRLVAAGYRNAARYSWTHCAMSTADAYRHALASPGRSS